MTSLEGLKRIMHTFLYSCGFVLLLGITTSVANTHPSVKGHNENEGIHYHATLKEFGFHFSTMPVPAQSTLQCAVRCTSLKEAGFVMEKHLCQCITKNDIDGMDKITVEKGSKVYIK